MTKAASYYLISVIFLLVFHGISPGSAHAAAIYPAALQQDNPDKKSLLNGRIWHNKYSNTLNDQFFLANSFLMGSVTFNGKRFNDLDLQYDIANDELILSIDSYPVIIMNKEMVDSFSLAYGTRTYHMVNFGNDTSAAIRGYANVLYNGPSALYVKYAKIFYPLGVDGRYNIFVQEQRAYLKKLAEIVPVKGKRQLFYLLEDKKKEIRLYLRSNRLKILKNDPGTFVPVLKYYDSIRE